MFYNSKKPIDIELAKVKLQHLIDKGAVFELKEKRLKRTIKQNSYLHLLLAYFALETGYSLQEVKQDIFKKIVNPDTFYEGEFGSLIKIDRWRSTADLKTDELTLCIERFRDYSSKEAGIYLPEPKDLIYLQEIEIRINNEKNYL